MKSLNKFMYFDWEKFSEGKEYTVTGCSGIGRILIQNSI